MNQKELLNLSLKKDIGGKGEEHIYFNYDNSELTDQSASYELLSIAISVLVKSIREEGRNPTVNEIVSIALQAIQEQAETKD